MKIGPKYKIAKRLGASVFEKTQTQKFALSEARKTKIRRGRRPGSVSDFGKQLLEKQKVRFTYGITERQFRNYVDAALAEHGANPIERLHQFLEQRLDNVVYRLSLAPTRRAARQMVSHGHILVNGKRITVPSHQVKVGTKISVREGSKDSVMFTNAATRLKEVSTPNWITVSPDTLTGEVREVPAWLGAEAAGDLTAVISFYSR